MICNMSAIYGAGRFIRFISMNPREIAKAVGEYKAKFLKAQGNAPEAATADAKLDKQ